MSDTTNEQDKARLTVRLAYVRELASVQAEQLEKSMLEIADLSEKIGGISADTIKSIREMTAIIALVKVLKAKEVIDDSH
jgi:hypothetical protein